MNNNNLNYSLNYNKELNDIDDELEDIDVLDIIKKEDMDNNIEKLDDSDEELNDIDVLDIIVNEDISTKIEKLEFKNKICSFCKIGGWDFYKNYGYKDIPMQYLPKYLLYGDDGIIGIKSQNSINSLYVFPIKRNNEIILKITKKDTEFAKKIVEFEKKVICLFKQQGNDEAEFESFLNNDQIILRLSKTHSIYTNQNNQNVLELNEEIDILKILPTKGILNMIILPIVDTDFINDKYKINYMVPKMELIYEN